MVASVYNVSAVATGFKRTVREGVLLNVGGHVTVDIRLQLGTVKESITVSGASTQLETDTVSAGRVIDNRSLSELPMPSNNVVMLAAFAPGVQERGSYRTNEHRAASVVGTMFVTPGNVGGKGVNDASNDYVLDGMPNVGNNRRLAYMPHTDSVQEFKIETSNVDASVGFGSGISLSMMTKAGGNNVHGIATWQEQEERWNAMQFFIKQAYFGSIAAAQAAGNTAAANALRSHNPQPPGHTHDYSFSLGGPVEIPRLIHGRNRLFFFFNFSGTNQRMTELTSNIYQTVPTALNRQGNFSDLLAAGAQFQVYDPLSVQPDPSRPGHYVRTPFPGNIFPQNRWNNPMEAFYSKVYPTPPPPYYLRSSL
jgi:hypothetical protein